ncbi:MAG: anhydro-N-acetylmuramic acid kinase [Candidatus Acidiferrales bacterium]
MSRPRRATTLVMGMMSGTSADGIDVALVRISARDPNGAGSAKIENFATIPYPAVLRRFILRIAEGERVTAGEISSLNFRIGEEFARAAGGSLRRWRVNPADVSAIGSHGQTIFHQGIARGAGAAPPSTLQIGEPAVIAARTGITTVADFRPADIAAGGQGAPLVPIVDYWLYSNARVGRVALNIGGIANLTVLPAGCGLRDVVAFDTGPGNMVIDALVRRATHGRQKFDRDARIATRGKMIPTLLERLLRDKYFRLPPPKTTGRERYGDAYVQRLVAYPEAHRASHADLIRTATLLTPLSIADAMNYWVRPKTKLGAKIGEMIVSGGGAHNPLIMAQLAAALGGIRVIRSAELGVPEDAKEAFAFALLAWETLHRRPSNVPAATGASRPAILGKICYAPAGKI